MKKFVCSVCGYVHEGDSAPEFCPQCKVPASKFNEQSGEMSWAAEHVVGVAAGAPEEILEKTEDAVAASAFVPTANIQPQVRL